MKSVQKSSKFSLLSTIVGNELRLNLGEYTVIIKKNKKSDKDSSSCSDDSDGSDDFDDEASEIPIQKKAPPKNVRKQASSLVSLFDDLIPQAKIPKNKSINLRNRMNISYREDDSLTETINSESSAKSGSSSDGKRLSLSENGSEDLAKSLRKRGEPKRAENEMSDSEPESEIAPKKPNTSISKSPKSDIKVTRTTRSCTGKEISPLREKRPMRATVSLRKETHASSCDESEPESLVDLVTTCKRKIFEVSPSTRSSRSSSPLKKKSSLDRNSVSSQCISDDEDEKQVTKKREKTYANVRKFPRDEEKQQRTLPRRQAAKNIDYTDQFAK